MKHEVKSGQTDYTVLVFIPDPASTDGSGKTGLVAANLTVSGVRVETDNDVTVTDYTSSLNNLASLTAAHNDWGLLEVSSTLAPGLYRLDFADAVLAAGAWSAVVYVMITTSAAAASPMEFVFIPQAPIDGVLLAPTTHTGAVVPTVTTLTNLPAAAALEATLLTVAGYLDTEVAAIKTKTDFLPSATAGAAGGLFIAGSNAATTVATWTSTGLTLYSDGVRIAAPATLNRPGFQITGNGSGEGVKVIGGATGSGIRTEGGATSGDGINAFGGVGGGSGATFTGLNGGHGIGLSGDTANFGIGMLASGYAGMWLQGTNGLHIQTNLTTETALFIQGGGDTPTGIVVTGGMKVTGPTAGDALTLVALAASGGAGFSAAGDGAGLDITAPDNDICTKALTVTTYAEPGQGAPPATTTLANKIGYPYKAWRNRTTQDATDYKLYADDAVTVDQKATVGDDTVTFDRGEIGTGP